MKPIVSLTNQEVTAKPRQKDMEDKSVASPKFRQEQVIRVLLCDETWIVRTNVHAVKRTLNASQLRRRCSI